MPRTAFLKTTRVSSLVADSRRRDVRNVISLADPVLGNEEKEVLCAVIDSGWLTMGERVAKFERAFADLHGAEDAIAVSSCTAGLHLCLKALGIGPGDQVLVPSLTFVATVNAVLYVKATPVFLDIQDEHTPHISLAEAEIKCTSRTKAVIVMHYGGYPVDLPSWRSFAETKGIFLIEDAAHAPAMRNVGRWSNASVFSFFTNKNMTTAEGGMVLTREKTLLERIQRLRSHGMTTLTLDRYRGHAYSYDVTMLGYNYRMDELHAAMGLVQLTHLRQWNNKRCKLSHSYRQMLATHIPEVIVPFSQDHETAAHLMPILLPTGVTRQEVMDRLRKAGIQSSIHYPPIHHFSYYRERFPKVVLPRTEEFCARELTLPLHPALTENDVRRIVECLQGVIHGPSI
jgi:dTDP-4-amino-4,6-dideoxygalactose transaminase